MSSSTETTAVADIAKVESMSAAERLEQRKKRFANVQTTNPASESTPTSNESELTEEEKIKKRKERFASSDLERMTNQALGTEGVENKKKGRGINKQRKTGGGRGGKSNRGRGGKRGGGRGGKKN